MRPIIVCGIEIETEYNSDKISIRKNSYHSDINHNTFGKNFFAESDGSLTDRKFGVAGETVEIISRPFFIGEFPEIFKDFQNEVIERSEVKELNKVLNFNDSCGAHIHISLWMPSKSKLFLSFPNKP